MVAGDASGIGGAAKRHAALASTAAAGSALALALLVAAPSCGKKEAQPEPEGEAESDTVAVTCVPAQRGKLDRSVDLRGRVATQPGGDLPVASLVPGKVVSVAVEEGAKLKK